MSSPPRCAAATGISSRAGATADDLFIHYVREGADGPDMVLLDPHALSPDHTVDVTLDDISQDGRVIVYGLAARRRGRDGAARPRRRRAHGPAGHAAAWPSTAASPSSPTAAASTTRPRTARPASACGTTRMGTPPEKDVEVFGAGYGPEPVDRGRCRGRTGGT